LKAIAITSPGGPEVLKQVERPVPEPGPSEIRVRVRASGLNRADILQRKGLYPPPAGYPVDIPGLEYAGEVDAVGSSSGLWAVGNRVMGILGGGAHAEYICVHEREAIRIPHSFSWEEAAAIPEVFLTAYDALILQLDIEVGERVLIHAIGSGVGTAALQLARTAGVITFGTSRTPEKLERARELGLDHAIDSSGADWAKSVQELTEGDGLNAIVDLVGGRTLATNLDLLSPRGRLLVVGTVAGSRTDLDLGLMLRKRLTMIGTVLRSRPLEEKISLARSFSEAVLPLFGAGRIKPVLDTAYSFKDVTEAHRQMEENRSFGKIVLVW
jgi:NADPH:quinone reductase